MRCDEIILKLEELSPLQFAADWDNVGLLAGRRDKKTERVCIALDATDEVIEEAVRSKADMLITHHPLIFKGMKRIDSEDFIGRRIMALLRNDISYYAMHTNFDVMGMADAAADEMGLRERKVLTMTYEDEIATEGCGRLGKLPRLMTLEECGLFVRDRFHLSHVRIYGEPEAVMEDAALVPGAGADMIEDAVKEGADVLITGDIKHHEGIDAVARGLCVIDAGHYGIEKLFVPYMKEYLEREVPEVTVIVPVQRAPFITL